MANPIIKIKRSSVPGKIPNTTSLPVGEFAINTYDGKVFLQQDQGGVGVGSTVITVNPWSVGFGSDVYDTYFTSGNVAIGTTNPTSKLTVEGDTLVSGVVTATGGFNLGISSAGTTITSGPITTLNFVGTGNTFAVNGTTVDISIQGGGGSTGAGGTWGVYTAGIATSKSVGINTLTIDDSDLTGIGNSFQGLYIGNGMIIVDNQLNGNHYIGTNFNGLMAGPVTINGTLTVDGHYVVV